MTTTVDVVNAHNEKVDSLELPEAIFGAAVRRHLLHEVVRMQLATRRQGTADTKGRSEVSGGGKKPWKQKGTGRARLPGGGSWPAVAAWDLLDGAPVDVVVRPEALGFVGAREGAAVEGRVEEVRFAGRETYFSVALADGVEVEVLAAPDVAQPGWKVHVAPLPSGPAPRAYPRGASE